jgi:hypothetical protein
VSRDLSSLDSVLDAFAAESDTGRHTLERYLRMYPEFAGELVDLSREIQRDVSGDSAPLTASERNLIDIAWSRYVAAAQQAAVSPVAPLTPKDWRAVAHGLDVPRQVVTALRERRVSLVSIPRGFLRRFAAAIGTSVVQLETSWGAGDLAAARSYKSDTKPAAHEQVTFEQVLIDAGVSAEKRARMLAGTE